MPGPFDFLHIRGRTAGSSNELSFDVLDATSRELKDKKAKRERLSKKGGAHAAASSVSSDHSFPALSNKLAKSGYSGTSGSFSFGQAHDITNHKQEQRFRRLRLGLIAAFVAVFLVFAWMVLFSRAFSFNPEFDNQFRLLVSRFVEVDNTIVEIDGLMADPLNTKQADSRRNIIKKLSTAQEELSSIKENAQEARSRFQGDEKKAAFDEIVAAADARQKMLTTAESTFVLSEHIKGISESLTSAWARVLGADTLAREASDLANSANTEQATKDARDKTAQAYNELVASLNELEVIEHEETRLDLSAEKAYVNKRLEALDAALATSDALLSGDREKAFQKNEDYNVADTEATELAAQIHESFELLVQDAFKDDINESSKSYFDAREEVTIADSAIRARL